MITIIIPTENLEPFLDKLNQNRFKSITDARIISGNSRQGSYTFELDTVQGLTSEVGKERLAAQLEEFGEVLYSSNV